MRGRMVGTAVTVVILIAGLFATPALGTGRAPGSRMIAVCTSPAPNVSEIAKFWDAGRTTHLRAWTATYQATGDALCAGTVEVVADIDITNGVGGLRGTVAYHLAGIDGGWTGTFEQVWAPDRGLLTYGREVATGYGDLAGWQLRAILTETFDQTITETDEVFATGR